ncbi:hypothetical protein Tco_0838837 [Tanacetum coccineum]|uniref:Uncharacterized protein n=1 Tax=Tanacetum coccineum TaxID=301880 RepID=A0ABQ5ANY0_9ASTR
MVQKPVLNNEQKGTGQREVRPVWNNAMRTNHQNFSNSRRNFTPTTVLTKSGLVPINTTRPSSSRAAVPVSTARPINTAAPKPFVNVAKPRPNPFQKSHSLSRRPFYQQTSLKNRKLYNKVNTAKVNSVNTAKGKRVISDVGKQGINAIKSSACWVWRPTGKVIDHVSKNSRSYICKQFDYVDPTDRLKLTFAGQTTTGKESSNPLMADSLPKTILPTNTHISILLIISILMAHMEFYDKHNMVAFLQKPTGSEEFHQITITVDTVNEGEQQLTVTVDGQTFAITKASVRRHLQLADADGISSLPNTEIFDQFSLMGPKKNSWEQFSSNIATAIICLASNRTFKFSKLIFDVHDQPGQGEGTTLIVESQHTPSASPSTSQPTTSKPTSLQEQPSQTSPHMPHDSPLPGGHTPGSVEGRMSLNELMDLCTKLFDKVTSLENDLKQTKQLYGKAITKLVKKVKLLEDKLKSTKERRETKMVISDDEEELDIEDTFKQGRMKETEFEDVVFTEFTPTKATQGEEQSQDSSDAHLGVLSAVKILADASREREKTYTRRRRSTDSSRVSTAAGIFSTAEDVHDKEQFSTDEQIAQKLHDEEKARAAAREEQERIDFEKALKL